MNQSSPNPAEAQPEDGLDRLLREYFQTQVPREFPPLPVDRAQPASVALFKQPSSSSRSRWVLAVCVALVLLGFGLLRSHSNGKIPSPAGIGADDTANGKDPMSPKVPHQPQE